MTIDTTCILCTNPATSPGRTYCQQCFERLMAQVKSNRRAGK